MKNQFKLLTLAASAAMMFAACTSDKLETYAGQPDLNPEAPSNAIQFGTYIGKSTTTRAGKTGSMTTEELKAADGGFGVFAWYTGTKGYGDYNIWSGGSVAAVAPNFMYNQKVEWSTARATDGTYVSNWSYTPLKFWPNEVANGAVDDQDNDSGNNPATTDYTQGGNLSFFAYAPYVASGSGTEGITAISANNVAKNPVITYVVPASGENIVDLLWGTNGGSSSNVLGTNNTGVTSTASDDPIVTWPKTSPTPTYPADILQSYKTNADLNKQKTNGKVEFAFKHALSKVGGYKAESGTTTNAGLMVILDIDNEKGAETGGSKPTATKVTISSINIKARAMVDEVAGTPTPDKYLKMNKGDLDLATGKWKILTESNTTDDKAAAAVTDYTILNNTGEEGQLNEKLAEPNTVSAWTDLSSVDGVLTSKAQNVYKAGTEAYPLVFIPGTYPELTVTIDYTVRTEDTNLSAGFTTVHQKIQKTITFAKPVELNKQYSLLMHLGLTSVKFDATVSEWDAVGSVTDITPTSLIEGGEIYLPINVGEATASLAFPAANETKVVNVSGGTTSMALTLTGLTDTQNYTVTSATGTVTGDNFSAASDFTAAGTEKTFKFTLAPNKGTTNVTREFTVTKGGVTQTIQIVQIPLPLVAAVAPTFNTILPNTAQASTALFTSLTDAAGHDVLSSATLTKSASVDWIVISSQNIAVNAQAPSAAKRSATVTATVGDASVNVVISQAAGD